MTGFPSFELPSSFDPAIYLHSEQGEPPDSQISFSDDLEGIHKQQAESTEAKNKAGIVIQHRAWRTVELLQSEEDYPIDTPVKTSKPISISVLLPSDPSIPPSSPPISIMSLISSPVTYPASSSPPLPTPRKKRRVEGRRSPLHDVPINQKTKTVGGFVLDESDEDDFLPTKLTNGKRKAFPLEEPAKTRLHNETTGLQIEKPPILNLGNFVVPHRADPVRDNVGISHGSSLASIPPLSQSILASQTSMRRPLTITTCSGKTYNVTQKPKSQPVSYEQIIAARSTTAPGRARKSYYGIDIHQLMDDANKEIEEAKTRREFELGVPQRSIEDPRPAPSGKKGRTLMWTEKYRARRFIDLVGDERTHRSVMRWLKSWDPIVFPGSGKPRPKFANRNDSDEEQRHRKVLLLTGPPGLGKTTLAHVCARQAGYEVQEINASDERSKDVVKGRIRDMVGTENVRGVDTKTANGHKVRKAGRPVCVVVDEVDGVVSGSGGGEGGFIKALIDLVNLDQRNSSGAGAQSSSATKKRRGDKFRLLRPMILICNDVYHPSLRPLRQSSVAEIIHVRKPQLSTVVSRMQDIFAKEKIPADSDGVRKLCEATWGVSNRKVGGSGSGTGEGDIRGIMVVGEWVAGRLRACGRDKPERLTRRWVEENILDDLAHGGGASRSLGRGGAKEVVERVFLEGAGFPRTAIPAYQAGVIEGGVVGVAEASKRQAMERLREMVDTSGDSDRIITDCFTAYPTHPWQDDTLLTKPCAASSWLSLHDSLTTTIHTSQEWELMPYLSHTVLAFHHLFASPRRLNYSYGTTGDAFLADPDATPSPFSGPSVPYFASETQKANRASLQSLYAGLSLPLGRMFRGPEDVSTELVPYLLRMLSPDIKPVIINSGSKASSTGSGPVSTASVRKASEKALVDRAVNAMAATGVRFERSRVDGVIGPGQSGGWVFRMDPPVDALGVFETMAGRGKDAVRYATRQVLDAEWKREEKRRGEEARVRRMNGGFDANDPVAGNGRDCSEKEEAAAPKKAAKRDFFGRIVTADSNPTVNKGVDAKGRGVNAKDEGRVWVSFHEGFSNAVRKPITIEELMRGL